jgi:hypothetical protein
MYEPHQVPPLPLGRFVWRMALHAGTALLLVAISLLCGMFGYVRLEQMPWLDAFLNAAMLLGGMGPVKTEGLSDPGKLFAGIYALYSGVLFIAVMAIMLAPVVHRVLHRFHWPEESDGDEKD